MNHACVAEDELLRYREGELTRNASEHLEGHLGGCATCRAELAAIEKVMAALGADGGVPNVDLVADVRRRAALPPPRKLWQRLRPLAYGVTAMAAALALYVALPHGAAPKTGFLARGGASSPDAWVRLRLYRVEAGRAPSLVDASTPLKRDDALLVAYDNLAEDPFPYLVVFAVDAHLQVYWYYPALSQNGEAARSIAVRRGGGIELPDEVRHALPAGPLRLFAVFTRTPLDVRDVEATVRRLPDALSAARLPIADSGQHAMTVHVAE